MDMNCMKPNRFIRLFRGGIACLQQHGFIYTLKLFTKKLLKRLHRLFPCSAKISIIIPVFNVERHLQTCLDSCVRQTMEDIEIICINDGSTDNSLTILRKNARWDRRIRIINKQKKGLSSARNTGLDHSRGEIIMFLDSDDYLSPNACMRVWEEMHKQPTDILIFGTDIFPVVPKAPDWYYRTLNVTTRRRQVSGSVILLQEHCSKPFVWRQAFTARLLKETGVRFDERVWFGEDIAFQMQIFPHAENFAFIADKLYHYCWYREGSLMHQFNDIWELKVRQQLTYAGIITEYWHKHGWLQLWGMEYTRWILQLLVPSCTNPGIKDPRELLKILNDTIHTFSLEKYFDEMTGKNKALVDTLKSYVDHSDN